jgi:5'(3')-deoxyribonucleotidase
VRLLLDCDGIVCDWIAPVVKGIYDLTGIKVTSDMCGGWLQIHKLGLDKDQLRHVERFLEAEGFAASLPVLPGAREGMRELYAIGVPVTFVTSPWSSSKTWEWERRKWLRQNGFWNASLTTIVSTETKFLVHGDMFVDDNPKQVNQWKNNNRGPAFLWSTPWNQQISHMPRLNSWEQLIKEVKRVSGLAA